jgi:hypothetical protein
VGGGGGPADVFPGPGLSGAHLVRSGGFGDWSRRTGAGSAVGWRSDKRGTVRGVVPGSVTVPRPEVSLRAEHIGGRVSLCGFASPSGVGAVGGASLLDTAGLPADRLFVWAERRARDTPGAVAL